MDEREQDQAQQQEDTQGQALRSGRREEDAQDTEGHAVRSGRREEGEASEDGGDVEGHRWHYSSDARLKTRLTRAGGVSALWHL